jgi:hypothetical protein
MCSVGLTEGQGVVVHVTWWWWLAVASSHTAGCSRARVLTVDPCMCSRFLHPASGSCCSHTSHRCEVSSWVLSLADGVTCVSSVTRYLPSDAWMFDFLMEARAALPRFTPLDVVATAHALASLHSSKTYAPPQVSPWGALRDVHGVGREAGRQLSAGGAAYRHAAHTELSQGACHALAAADLGLTVCAATLCAQEWVAALLGRAGRLTPQLDPGAAAGVLASAAHLGAPPPLRLVAAAVEGLLAQLQQQQQRQQAATGAVAGTGQETDAPQQQQQEQQEQLTQLSSRAIASSDVGVSEASLLLWALHRASLLSSQIGGWVRGSQAELQQLVAATQPLLAAAEPLELRRLATAVAGLGCSPRGAWWAAHEAAVVALLPHMRPEGLAEVAAAYQQARHPVPPHLQPYMAASTGQGSGAQQQHQQRQQQYAEGARQQQGQGRQQQEGGAAVRAAPALLRPGAAHRPPQRSVQHNPAGPDAGR